MPLELGSRFDKIYHDPRLNIELHEVVGTRGKSYVKIQLDEYDRVQEITLLNVTQFNRELLRIRGEVY